MSKTELSSSDEWETQKSLYEWLCFKYNFYPECDVASTEKNAKCMSYFTKETDGLFQEWYDKNWMNCPHSETEKWVKKACHEFLVEGHETMAIIPANSMCTSYAEACIEPHTEYHPIFERPKFLHKGEVRDSARNSYFVVIWRKRK